MFICLVRLFASLPVFLCSFTGLFTHLFVRVPSSFMRSLYSLYLDWLLFLFFFPANLINFAVAGSEGLLKLWTIKTNECVKTFDQHLDKVVIQKGTRLQVFLLS